MPVLNQQDFKALVDGLDAEIQTLKADGFHDTAAFYGRLRDTLLGEREARQRGELACELMVQHASLTARAQVYNDLMVNLGRMGITADLDRARRGPFSECGDASILVAFDEAIPFFQCGPPTEI